MNLRNDHIYKAPFENLELYIMNNVYKPSDDTYLLVDSLKYRTQGLVLDVGTGTGVGALITASKGCYAVGIDLDRSAVKCAKLNIHLNKLRAFVDVLVGDLVSTFRDEAFNIIAFNPPYLPVEEWKRDFGPLRS